MRNNLTGMSDVELDSNIAALQQQVDVTGQNTADTSKGAGFLDRLMGSFKSTPEDKLSFATSTFGKGNAAINDKGNLVWRKGPQDKWKSFDESGFSMADIADFAGDVPEVIGAGAGAVLGAAAGGIGAVPGAAAGGAAGNLIKQGISALLPGEEEFRPLSRVKDAAIVGGLSAVGQKAGQILAKPFAKRLNAKPAGLSVEETEAKRILGEMDTAISGSGMETGLSAAQRSLNPGVRIYEDLVRRNLASASVFGEFELKKQVMPSLELMNRMMTKAGSAAVPDQELGTAMKKGFDTAAKTLTDALYRNQKRGFQFLDEATGGHRMFPTFNFMGELEKVALQAKPGTVGKAFAREAKGMMDDIRKVAPDGMLSAKSVQDYLEWLGKAGYGKSGANIFRNLEKAADGQMARTLHKALTQDLDDLIASGAKMQALVPRGMSVTNVAKLLKEARNTTKTDMDAIRMLEKSVLGQKLGKDIPNESMGRLAEQFRKWRPEEIKASIEILDHTHPGFRMMAARNRMDDIMQQAVEAAATGEGIMSKAPLSIDSLMKNLTKDDTLKSILGNGSPLMKDVELLTSFLHRATQRTLSTYSLQNAGLVFQVLNSVRNPALLPKIIMSIMAPRKSAQLLTGQGFLDFMRALRAGGGKATNAVMSAFGTAIEKAGGPMAVIGEPESAN